MGKIDIGKIKGEATKNAGEPFAFYSMWRDIKKLTRNVPVSIGEGKVDTALKHIHDINSKHTGWWTSCIDPDRDMYNACANQSDLVVDLFHRYLLQTKDMQCLSDLNVAMNDLQKLLSEARNEDLWFWYKLILASAAVLILVSVTVLLAITNPLLIVQPAFLCCLSIFSLLTLSPKGSIKLANALDVLVNEIKDELSFRGKTSDEDSIDVFMADCAVSP